MAMKLVEPKKTLPMFFQRLALVRAATDLKEI